MESLYRRCWPKWTDGLTVLDRFTHGDNQNKGYQVSISPQDTISAPVMEKNTTCLHKLETGPAHLWDQLRQMHQAKDGGTSTHSLSTTSAATLSTLSGLEKEEDQEIKEV